MHSLNPSEKDLLVMLRVRKLRPGEVEATERLLALADVDAGCARAGPSASKQTAVEACVTCEVERAPPLRMQ